MYRPMLDACTRVETVQAYVMTKCDVFVHFGVRAHKICSEGKSKFSSVAEVYASSSLGSMRAQMFASPCRVKLYPQTEPMHAGTCKDND